MSSLSHLMILTSDTEGTNDARRAPMRALNAWCDEHANGQRFALLPSNAAGGSKVWGRAIWACCGNYFPTREFMTAFPAFGWDSYTADTTILVVRDETIHAGDAWIAIDGNGGALTKEPDLGYGRAEVDPSRRTPAEMRVLAAAIAWSESCEEDDPDGETDLALIDAVEALVDPKLDAPEARLTLFHWDYLDAIGDWGPGNAVAMAATKEEAIDLIVASCDDATLQPLLRAELVQTDPVIHDEPTGFTIMGSA